MRTRRRPNAQYRDRIRALWAAAVLLLTCSGGLYMSTKVITPTDRRTAGSTGYASGTSDETGDNYRSGSILFVPDEGNLCRKRVIDNKTWFIHDKGYVTCDEAVSWNATTVQAPRQSSVSRVEAIRNGFFKK